jgi:proline dehydrogenase
MDGPMTRAFFLFLSHRRMLRRWVETSRISRKLTKRFIAGMTLDDELAVCRRLDSEKILSTIDRLGENVTSLDEARASRDAYLQVLDRIQELGLASTVSIKLTQFGLDFSPAGCLDNVRLLVAKAQQMGTRIEIDMESSEYTDRTLEIVTRLHSEFGSVRAVIQAYLRRTEADIARLCDMGIPVRLCKGAYDEPHAVAFAAKSEVDRNYAAMSRYLLEHGAYPALATHDAKMIDAARAHAQKCGVKPDGFEFQMLYGIRRDLQRQIVAQGYRLRLYVPYGEAWYPYFMRRLAERPANVFFLLRNLLRA